MLKQLYNVLILTLAINFLAVAGGVGWLWMGGRLTRENVEKIGQTLFPATQPAQEIAQRDDRDPTTQPLLTLDNLLARASGRTAAEQVEFIQQSFDSQMATLDRRFRELQDLQRQVDLAKSQLASDRTKLAAEQKQLLEQEQLQQKLADDKGFQDSLGLYQAMPPRQVKTVFMGLDDPTVVRYLQAMPPRTASKIIKEFKTPDESARIQRVLEKMRTAQASADP